LVKDKDGKLQLRAMDEEADEEPEDEET
jgi:hypothetical protein